MFWNRFFFSECFDDVDFFFFFGGVKGDFLVNYTSLLAIPLKLCLKAFNSVLWIVFYPLMFKKSFVKVLQKMRRDV